MNHTTSLPPREPSPASGSPLRHDAVLAEYEGCEAVHGDRLEDITLERAEERRTDDCKTLRTHLGPARLSLIPTSSVFCLPVYLHSISLLTSPQNKTDNDRQQILIRIFRLPCSRTVRLARHCRHPVQRWHHRTSPHRATRDHHQYLSQARRRQMSRDRRRARNGEYGRASTMPSRRPTRACPNPMRYSYLTHPHRKMRNPDPVTNVVKCTSSGSFSQDDRGHRTPT